MKSCSLLYKKHKNVKKIKNGYDLKLLSFLKTNTEFTRNQDTFKNSYLLKSNEEKNMSCTWTIISIYYNKLQKTLFQNSFI